MEPVKLYENQKPVICAHCRKDLFENPEMSIVVFIEGVESKEIIDIYTCCKGECDEKLKISKRQKGCIDGWKDLANFTNPILFLKHIMAIMNNMQDGVKISDEAFESYKQLILSTAPYVMREPTDGELKKAINDELLPL